MCALVKDFSSQTPHQFYSFVFVSHAHLLIYATPMCMNEIDVVLLTKERIVNKKFFKKINI